MTTTRSYREAMPRGAAIAELLRCSGAQFDPAAIEALLAVIAEPGWAPVARKPAARLTPAVA